jgi:hypothetical protein
MDLRSLGVTSIIIVAGPPIIESQGPSDRLSTPLLQTLVEQTDRQSRCHQTVRQLRETSPCLLEEV